MTENLLELLKVEYLNMDFEQKIEMAKKCKDFGLSLNIYENPIPVVAVIVPYLNYKKEKRVLVVKRGAEPDVGTYCLPGGYVDKLESVEIAAARELKEETGLSLNPNDFILVGNRISTRNSLMIFVRHNKLIKENSINWDFKNEETLELRGADSRMKLGFKTHQEIMNSYWN